MRRMAEVTNVSAVTRELRDADDIYSTDPNGLRRRTIPEGVSVFEVNGPFFFGAAETFKDTMGRVAGNPKVLIIRMRNVPAIDSTGMHTLREVAKRSKKDGTLVLLSDVHTQPLMALSKADVLDEIGEENVFGDIDHALNRARAHLGLPTVEPPAGGTPTVARETPTGGVSATRPDADRPKVGS
jgi:SulP family sulfate permease